MLLHLSVILSTVGGRCLPDMPPRQTSPWTDTPEADTPPLGRHHPPWQTPPMGRHSPKADTPLPSGQTSTSRADTHLLGRHPPGQTSPPADGYCSGRYASYWIVVLFYLVIDAVQSCLHDSYLSVSGTDVSARTFTCSFIFQLIDARGGIKRPYRRDMEYFSGDMGKMNFHSGNGGGSALIFYRGL